MLETLFALNDGVIVGLNWANFAAFVVVSWLLSNFIRGFMAPHLEASTVAIEGLIITVIGACVVVGLTYGIIWLWPIMPWIIGIAMIIVIAIIAGFLGKATKRLFQ